LAQSQKALVDYKKKAQHELALANSRTAAAVQAKEDAELQVRAARSTADSAMEKSVQADLASRQAMATAKAQVQALESSTATAVAQAAAATQQLESLQTQLTQVESELLATRQDYDHLSQQHVTRQQEATQATTQATALQSELTALQTQNDNLRQNIRQLRDQLEDERIKSQLLQEGKVQGTSSNNNDNNHSGDPHATIAELEQELNEANAAIADLKDALMNSVNGQQPDHLGTSPASSTSPSSSPSHRSGSSRRSSSRRSHDHNNNGGPAPLLYAMEKQAELKTAQAEINRLANILSDIQAERTEAVESLELTKAQLEETSAKLERFQKLSPAAADNKAAAGAQDDTASTGTSQSLEPDSATTNIEYLKNIMMSYLNAKTIAEKKALVPVIGAVLCLTPREQEQALHTLQSNEAAAVTANSVVNSVVSSSFFQSLTKSS